MRYVREAQAAQLTLKPSVEWVWRISEGWPHINDFSYEVFVDVDEPETVWTPNGYVLVEDPPEEMLEAEEEEKGLKKVGDVYGYIVVRNLTSEVDEEDDSVDRNQSLLMEADNLDGDIMAYVSALQQELRCAAVVLRRPNVQLEELERILIVRHFQPTAGADSPKLIREVSATLATKEAPQLMLVDPRAATFDLQQSDEGKRLGEAHTEALLSLGLAPMVSSPCLWGWGDELGEVMSGYSYKKLLAAKAKGKLKKILVADDE